MKIPDEQLGLKPPLVCLLQTKRLQSYNQ